jgi:hypothetical protein
MNFSPLTVAWIQLISFVLGTSIMAGVAAYLGGAHWGVSCLIGVGTACTNLYHALAKSPQEKAAESTPPFPVPPPKL